MWVPVSAAAALLLAQAATGAPQAGASQTTTGEAATAQAKAADPVVCKSVGDTGSRFVHRICHTPQEWAQITADARSSTQQYQQGSSLGAPH